MIAGKGFGSPAGVVDFAKMSLRRVSVRQSDVVPSSIVAVQLSRSKLEFRQLSQALSDNKSCYVLSTVAPLGILTRKSQRAADG